MVNFIDTCLNICAWNVEGMVTATLEKSKDKAFIDQIKNFDIILLSETHIGYDTNINIEKVSVITLFVEKNQTTTDSLED